MACCRRARFISFFGLGGLVGDDLSILTAATLVEGQIVSYRGELVIFAVAVREANICVPLVRSLNGVNSNSVEIRDVAVSSTTVLHFTDNCVNRPHDGLARTIEVLTRCPVR